MGGNPPQTEAPAQNRFSLLHAFLEHSYVCMYLRPEAFEMLFHGPKPECTASDKKYILARTATSTL